MAWIVVQPENIGRRVAMDVGVVADRARRLQHCSHCSSRSLMRRIARSRGPRMSAGWSARAYAQ